MPRIAALITAAGSGTRLGGDIPKQYLMLNGSSILRRAVLPFVHHSKIDAIRIVIDPAHKQLYDTALDGLTLPPPVIGGISRQQSVRLGLEALAENTPPDYVLIHDGARPFITLSFIDSLLDAFINLESEECSGVIPALAVRDTVKRAHQATIQATVDREGLYLAQTPQLFRFQTLLDAHQRLTDQPVTDDASLLEYEGHKIKIINGLDRNFKVTTQDDLAKAKEITGDSLRMIRTGIGFDVHAFKDSAHSSGSIRLGGVDVPHPQDLEGHSDADVCLHAIVDAILGAIGEGDIGQHFPPSDLQWKGADSSRFLTYCIDLMTAKQMRLCHIDVTIIGERPKIGPHRDTIRRRVAELARIAPEYVNIKATTTEKLGFTGRGEGLAAQAIATVEG